MREWIITGLIFSALAGCSETSEFTMDAAPMEAAEASSQYSVELEAPEHAFGFAEAMQGDASLANLISASNDGQDYAKSPLPAAKTKPTPKPSAQNSQIAYSYSYGFRIDSDEINELQEAHIALCDALGEECRILRTSQSRADSYDAYGNLRMQIAADKAGDLTQKLQAPAEELGGALVSSEKNGEDLSEQIIDTQARLKSRLVLREKLTAILRNQRGSVDELVKAESEVAKVNQEIDATRMRLKEYRNRIRFSDVNISYEPTFGETQIGFVRPVMSALRSIGSTLGMSLAAIIYAFTALLPVMILVLGLRFILHRFGYRLRFWKTDLRKPASDTV